MRKLLSFYEALQGVSLYDEVLKQLMVVQKELKAGQSEESKALAQAPAGDDKALKAAIKSVLPLETLVELQKMDPGFNRTAVDKISTALAAQSGQKAAAVIPPESGAGYLPLLAKWYLLGAPEVRQPAKQKQTYYLLSCLRYASVKKIPNPVAQQYGTPALALKMKSIADLQSLLPIMPPIGEILGGKVAKAAGGTEVAPLGSYNSFIAKVDLDVQCRPQAEGAKETKKYHGEIMTEGQDFDLIGMEGNCIAVSIKTQEAARRVAIPQSAAWCTSWPEGSHYPTYEVKGPIVVFYLFDGQADPNAVPTNKWQATFGVKTGSDDFKDEADKSLTIGYENENTPEIITKIPETLRTRVADYVIANSGKSAEECYDTSKMLNYWDPRRWPSRVLEGKSVPEMLELYGLYEGQNCELDYEKKIVYVTDHEYVYEDKTNFGEPSMSF